MKVVFSLKIRHKIFLLIILPLFCILSYRFPLKGGEKFIKVGVPFDSGLSFLGTKGEYTSLSIDIIKHIAGSRNQRIIIIKDSLKNCIAKLRQKEIDIITDIPYQPVREADLLFSQESLYVSWAMVLSRPGIEIKDISDINGKKVIINADCVHLNYLKKMINDLKINCRLISTGNLFSIIELIHKGKGDIGIVNSFSFPVLPVNYNVKINPLRFDPVKVGFAVLKDHNKMGLLENVNDFLISLKEEKGSLYYRSMEYHFGKIVNDVVPLWMKYSFVACLSLIFILFALGYKMNKRLISYKNELRSEIDLRKRSESENLKAINIIQEKEVLVKEIHHRVKNNFMTIQSLLNLQFFRLRDSGFRELINELRNRIMSMSLIHEKTYFSDNASGSDLVSLRRYVNNLVEKINYNYSIDRDKIEVSIHIPDKFAESNFIIILGLIINELVSNVFKYAFPGDTRGRLDVLIENIYGDRYVLTVRDNGIGLPDEIDIHNLDTLGLEIVAALVAQINGTIEVRRHNGTDFKVEFSYDFK